MEIKDPKFKRGDKVIDEYGNIYIVLEISSYSFINNDYWYGVENDVDWLRKNQEIHLRC